MKSVPSVPSVPPVPPVPTAPAVPSMARVAATVASRALLVALAPIALAAGPPQDRIQLLVDLPGPGGALLGLAEATGTPAPTAAKLRGLEFLPLDFYGRSQIDALLPGRPRYLDDVPGASRVELPGVGGFLYRHSRELSDGTRVYGFLRVAPNGAVTPVAELSGTGPNGDEDPWLGRVAIDVDGRTLLAATRPDAGGNVLELDLVDGRVTDRSPNVPPLPWIEGGLALGDGFGIAISTRAVFRFDRAPDGVVQRVPLGQPAPSWYSGEVALSSNGAHAITTAGSGPTLADVWVFSRTGAGRKVNAQPGHLSGAGFLPDALHGPFLCVDDAGASAAWRAEVVDAPSQTATREAFLAKVEAPPGEDPVQVTADAYFTDTLDEVGLLRFVQLGKLIMAIGEYEDDPGEHPLEKADFFSVSLDAGGAPQFVNVTRSSGELAPPFLAPGELSPVVIRDLPESGGYLVWDEQSGGTGRLLHVRPDQPGLHTLLPDVKEVDFVVGMGSDLALSVRRRFATADPHQVLRVPRDLSATPALVAEVLPDVAYLNPVTTDDGWLAFLARFAHGPDQVQRVHIRLGGLESFPLGGGTYGEVLGLSPAGALLLSQETATGEARFFAWPFNGNPAHQWNAPFAPGHFVPGR